MLLVVVLAFPMAAFGRDASPEYARAPEQAVDQAYTDLIA